jgi:hypothetical protein
LIADPRSVEAVARQIKASGRAYSVFDVARLFMQDRARFFVRMRAIKVRPPQGKPDPGWGLHLNDANVAMGNLVDVVGRQAAVWKMAHP